MPSTTVEIKGKDNTSRAFNSVNKAIGGLKTGVIAIGTAITGATVALGAWFNSLKDTADRIQKVSGQLNISAEALQKFQFGASQSGVSNEKFNKSLQKLSYNLGQAFIGAKNQADAFRILQVNIKNSDGSLRKVDEILPEVADGFKALGDNTISTKLAQDLFERSGTELLNFLRLGSEGIGNYGKALENLGGVITTEATNNSADFNDRIEALALSFRDKFAPIIALANEALKPFTKELDRAKMTLPQLQKEIQGQINKLVKQRNALKDSKNENEGLLASLLKGARASTVSKASIQKQIDVLAKQRAEIEQQIEANENEFEQKKKLIEQEIKAIEKKDDATEAQEDFAFSIYETNDALLSQQSALKDTSKGFEELLVQKQNQIDMNAELFEEEKDFLEELEKEYKKKDFAYAKMVAEQIEQDKKKREEGTKAGLASIQQLSAGVKDESDDLFYLYQATSIGQAIMSTHEAAAKALTAGPVLGPIMAGLIYGLGMANVNKIRKEKPPSQRYLGGNVSAGQQYLVGERGPEILQMGNRGGNIVPNNAIGKPTNVLINISAVDARGIDDLLHRKKDTLVGIINQSLHRQTRQAI